MLNIKIIFYSKISSSFSLSLQSLISSLFHSVSLPSLLFLLSQIFFKATMAGPPSPSQAGVTHHSLTQVLKNFNKIRFLQIINLEIYYSNQGTWIYITWELPYFSKRNNSSILLFVIKRPIICFYMHHNSWRLLLYLTLNTISRSNFEYYYVSFSYLYTVDSISWNG